MLYIVLEYTPAGRYLFAVAATPSSPASRAARRQDIPSTRWWPRAPSPDSPRAAARAAGKPPTTWDRPTCCGILRRVLGATQIKAGRVNVLGTLIAVYLLATGVDGLQLAGAPSYIDTLFGGVALLVAVTLQCVPAGSGGTQWPADRTLRTRLS